MSRLDQILAEADPADAVRGPRVDAYAARAAAEAHVSLGRRQRPPRKRLFLPLVLGGALALTGAAAAVVAPLWFYNTDGELSRGDVVIPVAYETPDGIDVSCTYEVQFGARTADGSYLPLPDNFDALIEDLNAPGRWDRFGEQVQALVDDDAERAKRYEVKDDGELPPRFEWLAAASAVFRSQLPPELSDLPTAVATDCVDVP